MGTLNEDLASIKEVEDTITANKVANFAYTDKAYTDNDANGVIEYDVSKEQNIPSSDASILKVNETVLQKGYRAQASSVTRMLLNHFFGRVSYNLNKVNDCVSNLVTTLSSHLGKANGIATLDNDGHIPYSQLPESAVEYKGNWNANTNTPQLVDGTGNLGDMYIVSVAGRRDLGSGAVNYLVGDRIIYNQNNIWEKLSGGSVRSVEKYLPDASGNIALPVGIYTKGLVKQSDPLIKFNQYSKIGRDTIFSITYGNGMFVAVGNSGNIVTSTDGITWTRQTSPISARLWLVTYGNGMFVVFSDSGSIVTSTDGITWTKQTSPVSTRLESITYRNGMFVAVGNSGSIVTSTDGITWTKQTSPISADFSSVTYGNGMFVAVGESGSIVTSTDGITWTRQTSPILALAWLKSITYGNGMFVAVGDNNAGIRSTDGITWTSFTTPERVLTSITYENGMFVATSASGSIVTSTDGITWTKQTSPVSTRLESITYRNGMFVAVGNSGSIVTSTDGITWTKQTSPISADFSSVTYGNGMFVAVGESGSIVNYLTFLPSNAVKVDENNGSMSVPGIAELETKADSLDTKIDNLDTKVDSLEVKVDNLNVKANTPRWLRFDFSASNKQTLKILANTHIRVENTIVHFDTDTSFDLSTTINATSNSKGKDWYVFLDTEGNVTCSLSKTESAGKRRIGQFHTLCANAGASVTGLVPTELTATGGNFLIKQYNEEEDNDFYTFYNKPITAVETGTYYNVGTVAHPLSGFVASDILPESVWCLTFHPSCASYDGMVYDRDCDIAVDIYLQSGTGKATKSAFGSTPIKERQQWNCQEDMRAVGKRLLKDHEFTSIASGSNEKTIIANYTESKTVGGHVDTTGRRMISFIGCEECCGYEEQWLAEFCGVQVDSTTDWRDNDGQGSFGQQKGVTKCLIAGGGWSYNYRCGSRFRYISERSDVLSGARGSAEIIRSVQ